MDTRPVGSLVCHVHAPTEVPSSSRYVTTTNAPTYRPGEGPQRRKPARHRNQNAPRASGRSASVTPYRAYAPPTASTSLAQPFKCRETTAVAPSESAAR
jgi:hypothetical protein